MPRKTFCAVAVAAVAAGGVAACGKDESTQGDTAAKGDGVAVTYEVSSTVAKPFKVSYIGQTTTDSVADLLKNVAKDTGASSWKKEVALSKGSDYAFVLVTLDLSNFDSTAKYSCKITSGGKTIDEKKDQPGPVVGCAGLKLQAQVKKEGPAS